MNDGFVTVAALSPRVRVADVSYNIASIKREVVDALNNGARVIATPELAITGYTCQDLFLTDTLLDRAKQALLDLADFTRDYDMVLCVGVPLRINASLYNCAAVLNRGRVLGIVPKSNLPAYDEFIETRYFSEGPIDPLFIEDALFPDGGYLFGEEQLFCCDTMPNLILGIEICEDLWVADPPSSKLAQLGATVIVNLSASTENAGKSKERRALVQGQSARLHAGYIYTSAGWGESSADLVFGGHTIIAQDGTILSESKPFENRNCLTQIDCDLLVARRLRMTTFGNISLDCSYMSEFELSGGYTELTRPINPLPFVPHGSECRKRNDAEEILNIQSYGLAQRLNHIGATKAVLGISGGLDSTLALLVTARAFEILGLDPKGIIGISMPGFGTTQRTHSNAQDLVEALGATYREIPIVDSVRQHFADIDHDETVRDVVYENAQARERTQILMDIANQENTLVVGTGDLSELALGWATYNGDHMSMYSVNASVPKTLVRFLVGFVAQNANDDRLAKTLNDILATPVSPELLPANEDGTIAQITEDKVGPYELHDFFLYQMLRLGSSPKKIFRLACMAFSSDYDPKTILAWERVFYRRFFTQQYKRNCMPDGPKATEVSLSCRGDLRMASDASWAVWRDELDQIKL